MKKKTAYEGWIKWKRYLLHGYVTCPLSYIAEPAGWKTYCVLQHIG